MNNVINYVKLLIKKKISKFPYPVCIRDGKLVPDTMRISNELRVTHPVVVIIEGVYRNSFCVLLDKIQSDISEMMRASHDDDWMILTPYRTVLYASEAALSDVEYPLYQPVDSLGNAFFTYNILPRLWPESIDDTYECAKKNHFQIRLIAFNRESYAERYGSILFDDGIPKILSHIRSELEGNQYVHSIAIEYTPHQMLIDVLVKPGDAILDIVKVRYGLKWPMI